MKMVIAVRKDLNMRKGKMCAQCAHAATMTIVRYGVDHKNIKKWLRTGQKKIVVSVDTEEELLELHDRALDRSMPSVLVTDARHTEFDGEPTNTVVSIGPSSDIEVDKITGKLKLL